MIFLYYLIINKLIGKPLYKQLADSMEQAIVKQTVKHNELLPSEAELCNTFDISPKVVSMAYHELSLLGLIQRISGKGTFVVSRTKIVSRLRDFINITTMLRESGHKVVIHTPYMATKQGSELKINAWSTHSEETHYLIHRIHHVDDKPYLSRQIYMPVSLYPNLHDCYDNELSCVDLVEQLSSRFVTSVQSDFQVIKPSLQEIKYLDLFVGESVFYFYSRLYDKDDIIIATFHSYFPTSMIDWKLEQGEGMYV
jgi:DNA-binding GntR family transcriptional regulator